ncbi:hypothetical protein DASC09_023500 [Saccharomycopsis crataegensis]|uniref:CREG-like beta-barrel domain-containing protein n=1 Tax=Saccharomycopsis crataegensis TaxID=43959 RepID=A0AAV5QKJ0_9ASCO|nr:hypothetical protein DASC09_023500 [Saccharomycopsis crataegensis]
MFANTLLYLLLSACLLFSTMSAPVVETQPVTITSKKDYHEAPNSILPVTQGARVARTLVLRESIGNLVTLDSKDGFPVAFSEYYIDGYNTGDPVLILLNISSTWRNIKNSEDGKISFSIRTGDHQPRDHVNFNYPGGIASSTSGSPRISLKGKIVPMKIDDPIELAKLEIKFTKRHPDAKFWLPGSKISAHGGFWAKVEIESIYFIGGFGDRAFIGAIPVDLYHESKPLDDAELSELMEGISLNDKKFQGLVDSYQVPHHVGLEL